MSAFAVSARRDARGKLHPAIYGTQRLGRKRAADVLGVPFDQFVTCAAVDDGYNHICWAYLPYNRHNRHNPMAMED